MTLHTTYFGSVDWYRQIACAKDDVVYIEAHENYVKQTERNRCYIATANGKQSLSVPVSLPSSKCKITDVMVSDHGNWRHNHWEALKTAYGMSPFFDFYQDDIRPFYENSLPEHFSSHDISLPEQFSSHDKSKGVGKVSLFDYNLAIATKMLELLGITKELQPTESFQGASPLKTPPLGAGEGYYQTFQRRHGFIPGLSILDLLFNEGPESIKYLISF